MKLLRSQWWLHIPAAVLFATVIILPLFSLPWPEKVPIHFNIHGQADDWGFPLTLYLAIGFGGLASSFGMIVVRESMVRAERGKKRFDWLSLIIFSIVGSAYGLMIQMWWDLEKITAENSLDYNWSIGGAITLVLVTAIMEIFRKPEKSKYCDQSSEHVITEKEARIENDMKNRTRKGQKWVYSYSQSLPAFFTWLIFGVTVPLTAFAVWRLCGPEDGTKLITALAILPPIPVVLVVWLVFNAFHIQVSREFLQIRGGVIRIKLKRIELTDIANVKPVTFNPMDYGGWGLRYAGGVTGYIARGDSGVLIETKKGKKILISCYDADEFSGVLRAGAGLEE